MVVSSNSFELTVLGREAIGVQHFSSALSSIPAVSQRNGSIGRSSLIYRLFEPWESNGRTAMNLVACACVNRYCMLCIASLDAPSLHISLAFDHLWNHPKDALALPQCFIVCIVFIEPNASPARFPRLPK